MILVATEGIVNRSKNEQLSTELHGPEMEGLAAVASPVDSGSTGVFYAGIRM